MAIITLNDREAETAELTHLLGAGFESWAAAAPEGTPPVLQNQYPAPGASDVATDASIYLEITDVDHNVNASTIELTLEDEPVWLSGAEQTGYSVTLLVVANVYQYTIVRTAPHLTGSTIDIGVKASDEAPIPGQLDTTYSFQTVAPAAEVYNNSFEIAGDSPGDADGWTVTYDQSATQLAPIEGSVYPMEAFESGWGGGNQSSIDEYQDNDLEDANLQNTANTEIFKWAWTSPNLKMDITLSNDVRPSPTYPNPADAFAIGTKYRDMQTGGTAYAERTLSTTVCRVAFVDWLNSTINTLEGFAQAVLTGGAGHVIAELHTVSHIVADDEACNGITKQFSATLPNTPVHAKLDGKDSFFSMQVQLDNTTHMLYDDGAGGVFSLSAILDSSLPNTIDYQTGAIAVAFLIAPDAGSQIVSLYDYGAAITSIVADYPSNLPYIASATLLAASEASIPSYHHQSIFAYTATDVADGIEEEFESSWQSNENAIEEFMAAYLADGVTDSMETDWKNNQNAILVFDETDLEDGITEDFEGTWTTVPV